MRGRRLRIGRWPSNRRRSLPPGIPHRIAGSHRMTSHSVHASAPGGNVLTILTMCGSPPSMPATEADAPTAPAIVFARQAPDIHARATSPPPIPLWCVNGSPPAKKRTVASPSPQPFKRCSDTKTFAPPNDSWLKPVGGIPPLNAVCRITSAPKFPRPRGRGYSECMRYEDCTEH